MKNNNGNSMYALAKRLFPICRSLTGNGFRESLNILREKNSDIVVEEVLSGLKVFDWTIPKEWNIKGGYIETLNKERIIDFKDNNLHILGYSTPIDMVVSKEELLEHIFTLPNQPDWIPYVTSYYKEQWGFCMSENQKRLLQNDKYHVVIDSSLCDGSLTYGSLIIPGDTEEEIMITTYLCHPSMANNEISGPVVWNELISFIKNMSARRYTYRFVITPETIGSIAYINKNIEKLQNNVKACFVLSCVGDDRTYSMIASKYGNTLADRVLKNVLQYHDPNYKYYSFLKRGSDERQYGAPGVELPVCGFCRSKYGEYPEYHTSADNMELISPQGLQGAYDVMVKVINALEYNYNYRVTCLCEPQLGKRGLYPSVSKKGQYDHVQVLTNLITYCDGRNDLIDISNLINAPIELLISHVKRLRTEDLLV